VDYPVDHAPAPRRRARASRKYSANVPGLIAVAVAVTALSFGLSEVAAGGVGTAAVAALLAVASGAAGLGWQTYAHRRVRAAELQLAAVVSNAPTPPLSS
jgi:hypothetical protein